MLRRCAGAGERFDLARIEPHRMNERRARPQESDAVQVLDHRHPVELAARHHLQPRFLDVRNDGKLVLIGEAAAVPQEFLGAALRRRRRDDDPDPGPARMMLAQEVLANRHDRHAVRPRQCPQAGDLGRRESLVYEWEVVDDGAVEHRESDQGADADVLVGLERGLDVLAD